MPLSLSEFGLLGLILSAIGYAIYRCGVWVGPRLDSLINTHLTFVRSLDSTLNTMGENINRIDRTLEKQTHILEKLSEPSMNGKYNHGDLPSGLGQHRP